MGGGQETQSAFLQVSVWVSGGLAGQDPGQAVEWPASGYWLGWEKQI